MSRLTISEDEFGVMLRSFKRSAFRLETRRSYALSYEREEFERFLAGTPTIPPLVDWWRPWLEQIAQFGREGKTVSRVRVLAEPPTPYQRWELWAAPWHARAGEDIRYMPQWRARQLGLLDNKLDWWLLDDERVILMRFTKDGEIDRKTLTDDPAIVARHLHWRDLAVRNATPAEDYAAA
jgi:hypothetical protein